MENFNGLTMVNKKPFPNRVYGTAFREGRLPPSIPLAVTEGYRVIDTSSTRKCHDERIDGQQLAALYHDPSTNITREDIFLQTKFTPAYAQGEPLPFDVSKDSPMTQVYKSALRSAEDLQTEYFDMYMMHYPMENNSDTIEVWQAMETMHDRNATRYLGLRYAIAEYLKWLWAHARVKPAAIQNPFSKATQYDEKVIQFCRIHGIMYQAFGVFSNENKDLMSSPAVLNFAEKYSISTRQALSSISTALYASDGVVFCLLDGTSDPRHMKENLAGTKYDVTEAEITGMRKEMWAICEKNIILQ